MAKLLVFANCQANPVASLIQIASPSTEIVRCPAVHTITNDRRDEIINLIAGVDIVVHQPIGERFGPIASEALKEIFPEKIFVSFPSIYFSGLFPQLCNLHIPGGGVLKGPLTDYHDIRIVAAFLAGKSGEDCIRTITSDEEPYESRYRDSMMESLAREQNTDIRVMPTITAAQAERPCMFTFNHPDNLILFHVAQQAVALLGLPSSPTAKAPLRNMLGAISAAVPQGLLRHVGAAWTRSEYAVNGEPVPHETLVESFYGEYSLQPRMAEIARYNNHRSNLRIALPN